MKENWNQKEFEELMKSFEISSKYLNCALKNHRLLQLKKCSTPDPFMWAEVGDDFLVNLLKALNKIAI